MKRLLIVVDYQNDYVVGPLGFPEAALLEDVIYKLVRDAESFNDDVVFTRDIHGIDYASSESSKHEPIPHCIAGSGGEEFYGKIKRVASRHVIFDKNTFGSSSLGVYLGKHHYDRIDLCGLDFRLGVLANAIIAKEVMPQAEVRILLQASGCKDKEAMKEALEEARRHEIVIFEA